MKKIASGFLAFFAMCMLYTCQGGSNAILSVDTAAQTDDTTRNSDIVVGKDDALFITRVGAGCLAEIKIGALAKQKGKDKRIKNFGAMMVKDLTKGHGRLEALAKSKKIILPNSINAADQAAIDSLAGKTGKEFDRAYLGKVKSDYQRALSLFQITSKGAFDPQIKAFATKNVFTIQRHLDLIDAMHASVR